MTIEESSKIIKEKNPNIHAFLEVFDQPSLKLRPASDKGVLSGKPIAIKDNMVLTHGSTTASSKILENFEAPYVATAVQKIIDAGGVIMGKTNLDEFAMGSSTENSAYGPTKNPNDISRVPGGSSGGSAAAVASGMVWGALGSDTGGSIRQPAAFCGVVGFKPTYGTVSRYGLMAMGSSLDVIGPFAKTVADARLIYDVIAGKDEKDATSRDPVASSKYQLSREVQHRNPHDTCYMIHDTKIGIPKEFFGAGLDKRIKDKIDQTVKMLEKNGATIKQISLPHVDLALAVYYIIMPVEVASNLARYDGIKYGYSIERLEGAKSLLDVYIKSRAQGFGAEVKRRIMLGTYASSAGYVDQYYNKAQAVREIITQEFADAFKNVDAIITPVTPSLPFKFGEKGDDPLKMYLEDIYTVPANIAGIPALSVPIGTVKEQDKELPVGIQILGKKLDDYFVLALGEEIENAKVL